MAGKANLFSGPLSIRKVEPLLSETFRPIFFSDFAYWYLFS